MAQGLSHKSESRKKRLDGPSQSFPFPISVDRQFRHVGWILGIRCCPIRNGGSAMRLGDERV